VSRLWPIIGLIVLTGSITPALPGRVFAQSAGATDLKAAFLLNFTKFSEWPELPPHTALTLCVVGDQAVDRTLSTLARGQRVNDRDLEVKRLASADPVEKCQLLFVAAAETATAKPLLDGARKLPILTVSDLQGFAAATGIVELFVEGGRMRFAINVDAVQRSKIRVSSRLLQMAKIVNDKTAP
jgi:hypothetical protein